MKTRLQFDLISETLPMRWILGAGWSLILLKCALVWWAVGHWQVPINPMWVIVPTLLMAGLATFLWITHREE